MWYKIAQALRKLKYSIPSDKEELLYDFYMIISLPNRGYSNDDLQYLYEDTKEKIIVYLKKELLEGAFFAISSEMRHAMLVDSEEIDAEEIPGMLYEDAEGEFHINIFSLYKKIYGILGKKDFRRFMGYKNRYDRINDNLLYSKNIENEYKNNPLLQDAINRRLINPNISSNKRKKIKKSEIISAVGRASSYVSAMDIKGTKKISGEEKMVQMAKSLFLNLPWDGGYGGEAWANICDAWLLLYKSKSQQSNIIYIDHIFDIQHNNDTILDKLYSYYKDSGYGWIQVALTYKANIKDIQFLYGKTSPSMKTISRRLIKDSENTTEEDWRQKHKDIRSYEIESIAKSMLPKEGSEINEVLVKTPSKYVIEKIKEMNSQERNATINIISNAILQYSMTYGPLFIYYKLEPYGSPYKDRYKENNYVKIRVWNNIKKQILQLVIENIKNPNMFYANVLSDMKSIFSLFEEDDNMKIIIKNEISKKILEVFYQIINKSTSCNDLDLYFSNHGIFSNEYVRVQDILPKNKNSVITFVNNLLDYNCPGNIDAKIRKYINIIFGINANTLQNTEGEQ